ncbi:MAG: rod shape-determining protein MreC [Puniceicoccales bacterium]|nr:rod shape-determining protein MreC [Puniceicoccales bacterium]
MKDSKKFSENCLAVADKRHNIASYYLPLVFVIALTWLIPASFRNNVKSAFTYVQIPIYAASIQLENLRNAFAKGTLSGRKLTTFCENLMRENMALQLKLATLADNALDVSQSEQEYHIGNFVMKPARVIRRDIASWTNELVINVGANHGIAEGMGVISQNYAVGRIKSVNAKTSVVELISSPQFRMVVHVAGDTARSPIIFSGNGHKFFSQAVGFATNIPTKIVSDGEPILLVTSELSGVFPENIAVGFIKSQEEHDRNFFSSDVTLNGDLLSKLYEVAILVNLEDQK